jgi:hypothetical protein
MVHRLRHQLNLRSQRASRVDADCFGWFVNTEAVVVRIKYMATYTPPPYFPQGSLAPPDKNKYRKFKLIVAVVCLLVVLALAGLGLGIWYLIRSVS